MSKSLYLIIILSVVLLKSETSFGQTLKKELGICGKTMSVILNIGPKVDSNFTESSIEDKDFCDNGRYEQDANFVISLYNSKGDLVYDKKVYLSTITISEGVDKNKMTFNKTKIVEGDNSRIVKFPITKDMGEVTEYKITSLENKKVSEKKKIKW